MAKRGNGTRRKSGGPTATASGATAVDAMEHQVLAFAEQVGRIAGAIQVKAEGWMDAETLKAQIANVRDGAANLLAQLAGGATRPPNRATKSPNRKPSAASARGVAQGRSGAVVDAPGKKHRKPLPSDPGATLVDSQAAKLRTATPMVKTKRLRGRG